MNMMISGVTEDKSGNKRAYLLFEDGSKSLEATIPDCVVKTNNGFTCDEESQILEYIKDNLAMLKREAAKINPIKAMMK